MKVFSTAILMVFCSLLGSAFSIKCLSCSSLNTTVCDGKPVDCPGDQCMTISQVYHYEGILFYSMYRGCANSSLCGTSGSVTQGPKIIIRVHATCCKGPNCNTDKFFIPEDDTKPNGIKCPSTYCAGMTKECNKDVTLIECRGSETCCADYSGRILCPDGNEDDYSFKGCMDPNGCKYNFQYLRALTEIKRHELKCCKEDKP